MKKLVVISIVLILLLSAYWYFMPSVLPPGHLTSLFPAKYARGLKEKNTAYLIKNVTVIPITQDTIFPHHFVLIEHSHIKQITSRLADVDTSGMPFQIEGTGKYLIPGLNDMHVHINDDNNLLLFVANGVTTIRNMAGYPFHLKLRQRIQKQQILGPTLYTASPILEGTDNVWKFSVIVKTKREAREAVLKYKKAGYDFIKIYHTLPEELYKEILRVGDSLQIPVTSGSQTGSVFVQLQKTPL